MKELTHEELDRIEQQVKAKISEKEGRGDFGLWACVESIVNDLKRFSKGDVCLVRRHFLNSKESQGAFWNDGMFKALNLVEAEIYGLKY